MVKKILYVFPNEITYFEFRKFVKHETDLPFQGVAHAVENQKVPKELSGTETQLFGSVSVDGIKSKVWIWEHV